LINGRNTVASRQSPKTAAVFKGRKQLQINKAAKFINNMNLAVLYLKIVLSVPDSRRLYFAVDFPLPTTL
jgi:hypothetical protein